MSKRKSKAKAPKGAKAKVPTLAELEVEQPGLHAQLRLLPRAG